MWKIEIFQIRLENIGIRTYFQTNLSFDILFVQQPLYTNRRSILKCKKINAKNLRVKAIVISRTFQKIYSLVQFLQNIVQYLIATF